jgi:hypothetical protein
MQRLLLALVATFLATSPMTEIAARGQLMSGVSRLGTQSLVTQFSGPEMSSNACLEWARTRPTSEDRRLISVFANRGLSGQVRESFDEDNPPIVPAITNTDSSYRSNLYTFDLFDIPKDKFETTSEYLGRRRSAWSQIILEEPINLNVSNKRFEFNYNADKKIMRIEAKYYDRNHASGSIPPGLRFYDEYYKRKEGNRYWSVFHNYFISANDGFLGRFNPSAITDGAFIEIPMDVSEARALSSSGSLFLRLTLPIFKDRRKPVAFQDTTTVFEIASIGYNNTIFADLECAVFGTAGGLYYDLLD